MERFFPNLVDYKENCFTKHNKMRFFSKNLLLFQLTLERTYRAFTISPNEHITAKD